MGDLVQLSHRPKKRGECESGIRPCPFVSCRYHLGHGIVRRMAGESDEAIVDAVLAMAHTCSLDVADEGGTTLARIGRINGTSRERARQVFKRACVKIGADPKYLERYESDRMDAAVKAYIDGDSTAAAAEFGYEVSRLRDLAISRDPEGAKKKRRAWTPRTTEEKLEIVEKAKGYPSLAKAAAALNVAPASLNAWVHGRNLGGLGGKRTGAGRKKQK